MTLTILGLGPGDIDDLTRRAWRALKQARTIYLRTAQHGCVPCLPQQDGQLYILLDEVYEQHDRFEDVYAEIVRRVMETARAGDVVYAVPGDPMVGEATTAMLIDAAREAGVTVEIVSGVSFIEPSLKRVGMDAIDGVQIADGLTLAGMHHPPLNPDRPALIAQVYSRQVASEVKLTLMNQYPDEFPVTLIHAAGTEQARAEPLPLYAIDRSEQIGHLTSLYVPALGGMSSFEQLQEIMAHLRAPEGCPWDQKQTHESLRRYLLEETYEVLEAIDQGDWDALAEELGDLLLQVVFHAQIATEAGEFSMAAVLRHISQKLVRRHPHVWGTVEVNGDADQVVTNWEQLKKQEHAAKGRARESALDGVPLALPALLQAHQIQSKAARVKFDWERVDDVIAKVREEIDEVLNAADADQRASEVGDLLFAVVNWARWLDVEPENALRAANARFYRRFRYLEEAAADQGRALSDMTLAEMDALWNAAKSAGL
jgi:tetrapyrrole methylase family protein/MazG family protein